MCGIAGILRFDGGVVNDDCMRKMLDKLAHRGRDCSGLVSNLHGGLSKKANISFGHRRLSIIDLSDSSAQPMSYCQGKLWIVFNGEIYNYLELKQELVSYAYIFQTNSDTEVLLAAYDHWGEACVEHLNGMFSFALWDEEKGKLFCARDELGIKPFYFYQTSSFIVFSSESKALSGFHHNHLNRNSVASYMLSLYIPSDWSVFEGVKQLAPAHIMSVGCSGEVSIKRYWSVKAFADIDDCSSNRNDLMACLEYSVSLQLRSDVPVGALLSGGVDSGIIVALASEKCPDLHTYSVGFDGMPVNELAAAANVAKRYKTQHHECLITDQEAMQALDLSIQCLSEPIADPAIVPSYVLSQMAASNGVKVLLSGSGGDEVFGGYTRYAGGGSWQRTLMSRTPETVRCFLASLLPMSKMSMRLKNVYLDMMFNTSGDFDLCASVMGSSAQLKKMLESLTASFPIPSSAAHQPLLYKQMIYDKNVYLPNDLLFLFDQMTMAHTIEGRVPLIDKYLVEKSFRFPPESHVLNGRTKKLFRELAEPYLGHEHVWRKKQGFSGPVPCWVNQHQTVFLEAAASVRDIFSLQHMDLSSLLNRAHKEKNICSVDAHALFILYCFRRWYDALC